MGYRWSFQLWGVNEDPFFVEDPLYTDVIEPFAKQVITLPNPTTPSPR